MTVSAAASKIYQTAKAASKGVWRWRLEWSKAMKMAWRKVMVKTNEIANAVEEVSENIKKTSEAHEVAEVSEAIYTGLAKIYVYCITTGRTHKDASFQSISALYRGGISAYSFDPIKTAEDRINSDFGKNAISEINKKMA